MPANAGDSRARPTGAPSQCDLAGVTSAISLSGNIIRPSKPIHPMGMLVGHQVNWGRDVSCCPEPVEWTHQRDKESIKHQATDFFFLLFFPENQYKSPYKIQIAIQDTSTDDTVLKLTGHNEF